MDKYSELKESFNNFANNINSFTNNIDNLTECIMDTIDNYKDHMNKELKRIEADSKPNGVVIDHPTFSKLINTLAYGVSVGTVEKELYDAIVKIGLGQTKCIETKSEKEEKPQFKIKVVNGRSGEEMYSYETMDEIIKHMFG